MEQRGHQGDARAHAPDSDVTAVAVVAAKSVENHHERASRAQRQFQYPRGSPHGSRFNRRLRRCSHGVGGIRGGTCSSLITCPCPSVAAHGQALCGYCGANDKRLVSYRAGQLPASDGGLSRPGASRTPRSVGVGGRITGATSWTSEPPVALSRRFTVRLSRWACKGSTRANAGFDLKVVALLIALVITNADWQLRCLLSCTPELYDRLNLFAILIIGKIFNNQ